MVISIGKYYHLFISIRFDFIWMYQQVDSKISFNFTKFRIKINDRIESIEIFKIDLARSIRMTIVCLCDLKLFPQNVIRSKYRNKTSTFR